MHEISMLLMDEAPYEEYITEIAELNCLKITNP